MSTPQMAIAICDDTSARLDTWTEYVEEGVRESTTPATNISPVPVAEFAAAITELKKRLRFARDHRDGPPDNSLVMDSAAMVVVDFDLTPRVDSEEMLEDSAVEVLTGEFGDQVSYLLRAFSGATYTAVVNQGFSTPTFDLTHSYFRRSTADLNLVDSDLANPLLWSGASDGKNYRPWHWPRLIDEPTRYASLAASLNLGSKVLATLGLDKPEILEAFDKVQLDDLGGKAALSATFMDMADLGARMQGMLPKAPMLTEERQRQIAVSTTCQWLERTVLAAQNVIVDAPHLATRRPGVLSSPGDSDLQPLADLSKPGAAEAMLDSSVVSDAQIPALDPWLSRPVWVWSQIPRVPTKGDQSGKVFCEDVSGFADITEVTEYSARVPGRFRQRFVRRGVMSRGESVGYAPSALLYGDE